MSDVRTVAVSEEQLHRMIETLERREREAVESLEQLRADLRALSTLRRMFSPVLNDKETP